MKQVTMESVKQRIADLESAGKVVGGLSLSSEFELACLRELVVLTEQRDALAAENAVLIDLARKFADRADDYKGSLMGFSVFESFNELKSAGSKEATSSAIASLRAEGVEMLAKAYETTAKDSDDFKFVNHCNIKAEQARDFARQLRESKGADHE
ncbi:hypothetical protein CRX67_03870 [Enterobacteriaceae bacterium A-F18]|nr:hypothetical protein CRX67_03870 [Enterobacteriaceae bacterium A-F18]